MAYSLFDNTLTYSEITHRPQAKKSLPELQYGVAMLQQNYNNENTAWLGVLDECLTCNAHTTAVVKDAKGVNFLPVGKVIKKKRV